MGVSTEEESEEDSEDTLLPLLLPLSEDNGGPKGELPHNAIGAGNTIVIRVACAGWYKGGAVGATMRGDKMMDCEKVVACSNDVEVFVSVFCNG
jgi:hypothetical protein